MIILNNLLHSKNQPKLVFFLTAVEVKRSMRNKENYFTCFVGRHVRTSVSVSDTVTAVSEASVSAVVSVTAVTKLTVTAHFQLRPKPEKLVSVVL